MMMMMMYSFSALTTWNKSTSIWTAWTGSHWLVCRSVFGLQLSGTRLSAMLVTGCVWVGHAQCWKGTT